MSGMWIHAKPYGWNNLDFLLSENIGPRQGNFHLTQQQARAQFSVYAAASSDLIISNDITSLTAYDLDTYGNVEVIAVNQDGGRSDLNVFAGFKVRGVTPNNGWAVFGKMLSDGSFAAVFLNTMNTVNMSMDIECDEGCFVQMGFNSSVTKLNVRDLYQQKDLGQITALGTKSGLNGALEMGMCYGEARQVMMVNSDGTIQAKVNNGYLGTFDCNTSVTEPVAVTFGSGKENNNECGGKNQMWEIKKVNNPPSYCNGYECVNICNSNNGKCLLGDTMSSDGGATDFAVWKDGTVREMQNCGNGQNIQNACRCLQMRPIIGESLFSYTVKGVPSNGGVVMLKFTPM